MNIIVYNVQLRIIPIIGLAALCLVGIYAGLLLTSGTIPINDKLQHFVFFLLFGGATYWTPVLSKKRCSQAAAAITVIASITSEFLQAYLTERLFDPVDIVANLLGSGLALV